MNTPGSIAVLKFMTENDIPLTRENFVNTNWGGNPPRPWDAEAEEEIPLELAEFGEPEENRELLEDRGDLAGDDWAVMASGKIVEVPAGTKAGDTAPDIWAKDAFDPQEPRKDDGEWTSGGGGGGAKAEKEPVVDVPAYEWAKRQIDKHTKNSKLRAKQHEWMARHKQNVDAFFKKSDIKVALDKVAKDATSTTSFTVGAALNKGADVVSDALQDALIAVAVGAGVAAFGVGGWQVAGSAALAYAVEELGDWLGLTPENAVKLIKAGVQEIGKALKKRPQKDENDDGMFSLLSALPWDHPVDPKTNPFIEGEEFVSPNVKTGLDLQDAIKETTSPRHKTMIKAARDINKLIGFESEEHSAIGAWLDGAENSVMSVTHGATMAQLRTAAAMEGALANQRSVMIVNENVGGKGLLYHFDVKGDVQSIHDGLLASGVEFHTIVPSADGKFTVYVASADSSQREFKAVQKAAERFNAKVEYHRVDAELVGSDKEDGTDAEQREDAQSRYGSIIEGGGVQGAKAIWGRVYSRYKAAFEDRAVKKPREERPPWRTQQAEGARA